jgi:hypothetical protein
MKTVRTIFLFATGGTATEIEHPCVTATVTVKKMFTPLADWTSS